MMPAYRPEPPRLERLVGAEVDALKDQVHELKWQMAQLKQRVAQLEAGDDE